MSMPPSRSSPSTSNARRASSSPMRVSTAWTTCMSPRSTTELLVGPRGSEPGGLGDQRDLREVRVAGHEDQFVAACVLEVGDRAGELLSRREGTGGHLADVVADEGVVVAEVSLRVDLGVVAEAGVGDGD